METYASFSRIILIIAGLALGLFVALQWYGTPYLFLSASPSLPNSSGSVPPSSAPADCDPTVYTGLAVALEQPQRVCFLDLSNQNLSALPNTIGNLEHLTSLNVSKNQLTKLPAHLGWLRELKELTASNNRLTVLPAHIGWLRELTVLDISNNQLTLLPEELGWLTQLERLDVRGNPLPSTEIEKVQRLLPQVSIYH